MTEETDVVSIYTKFVTKQKQDLELRFQRRTFSDPLLPSELVFETKIVANVPSQPATPGSEVGAGDRVAGDRAFGENLIVLLDVQDVGCVRVEGLAVSCGSGAGKRDGSEVSEGNQLVVLLELVLS